MAADDSPPVAPDGRPLRVLVVEDEAGIAEALVAAFRFRGWDADSARTVAQATELVRLLAPDLVVLDVILPDGDGFELLGSLRARNPEPRRHSVQLRESCLGDLARGDQRRLAGRDDLAVDPDRPETCGLHHEECVRAWVVCVAVGVLTAGTLLNVCR